MNTPAIPLNDFDDEMKTTRRVLERIPTDKFTWKPHEKSFALGHLAQLVARMPSWITSTLKDPDLDLAGGPGYSMETTEALLALFDKNVAAARAALASVTGAALEENWSLKNGSTVLMTLKRGDVTRANLRHLVHHRGQLTVYLRLINVPVPMIYGPTADERWGS